MADLEKPTQLLIVLYKALTRFRIILFYAHHSCHISREARILEICSNALTNACHTKIQISYGFLLMFC